MDEFRLVGFTPDTLVELCVQAICDKWPPWHYWPSKSASPLPAEVGDRLLQVYHEKYGLDDAVIPEFCVKSKVRLRCVHLPQNHKLSQKSVERLLSHKLKELHICNGPNMANIYVWSSDTFSNMTSLRVVKNHRLFEFGYGADPKPKTPKELIPKLTNLSLVGHVCPHLCKLETLKTLELSNCRIYPEDVCQLKNLTSLTLYNVQWVENNVCWIRTLVNLRHLDISQPKERYCHFERPNEELAKIVKSLPLLKSLDISGTNLAGTGGIASSNKSAIQCDIPGLSSRINNPLDFLGLYGTMNSACCRHDIPAIKISGDANEEQILTAATLYMGRPEILTKVLNDLYHLFRSERNDSKRQWETLNITLKGMDMHINERSIQICGSAVLFYIVKGKNSEIMGIKLRRHIVTTLLKALETYLDDPTMMRNGCLTLCQLKIPADVVFEYKRVVFVLLKGVSNNDEVFVQRVAIYLLNSFACQVDAVQKRFLGDHGVIRIMLTLISERLIRAYFDDVLEVAWSTMWNVTDETPINCQRFLDNDGLRLFMRCLKSYPDKEELLRNMMGLLGNVAEVRHLRPIFMSDILITEFVELLDSQSDGIEVSYNAGGVIAHLASDGKFAWSIENPTREEALRKMVKAIRSWNINSKRNINYRSFEPLVGLLKAYHTPECQHWAVWALANLTTVYPEKYCSLIIQEKAIQLLNDISNSPFTYQEIKNLANCVLRNCLQQNSKEPTEK